MVYLFILILLISPITFAADVDVDPALKDAIQNLRSDQVRYNAYDALFILLKDIYDQPDSPIVALLKQELKSDDYQQRQIATYLLYRNFRHHKVPESDWPQALIANMVEGLKRDQVHGFNSVSNATTFAEAIYSLESRRPIEPLKKWMRDSDPQARFAASVILAKYWIDTVQPELSQILFQDLKRQNFTGSHRASFRSLIALGKKNFQSLFKKAKVENYQQAAYFQILCSLFGVTWKPTKNDWIYWLEEVKKPYGGHLYTAALYLSPSTQNYLTDQEIPPRLQKILDKGPRTQNVFKRIQWAQSYFYFLRPKYIEYDREVDLTLSYLWIGVLTNWD